ncbi:hypothetical protein FISHEDRAFT_41016, partial [Fistulina hepatica ATCC 64428]
LQMQVMSAPNGMGLDFLHMHHSRSGSLSSASSRPASSQGLPALRMPMGPSTEDLYRANFNLAGMADHSPTMINKGHMRPSHIRARAAASPYPRDTDSVHSSSSENEDMAMFLGEPSPAAEYSLFTHPAHLHGHDLQTAAAINRMHIATNNDQALEKLAGNVRAATTTSASDRAKQIFVQAWLTANYAPYPDGNVPRQGLYFSYRRVCEQYGIPHINTATLGKAIRLCFPTIKTRRLGVRGNSKYHYCGIRPATSAEAEWLQDYIRKSNNTAAQQSVNAARLATAAEAARAQGSAHGGEEGDEEEDEEVEGVSGVSRNSLSLGGPSAKPRLSGGDASSDISDKTPTAASLLSQAQAQAARSNAFATQASIRRHASGHHEFGDFQQATASSSSSSPSNIPFGGATPPMSVRQFPHFPSIEEAPVSSPAFSAHNLAALEVWSWFQDHLDSLLESVRAFRFDQFELHIRTFWSSLNGQHREVVHAPAISGPMAKADAIVYDEILELLRAQMLSPIPAASLANLRQLALKMEKILLVALDQYGNTFVEPKVELGARFGHLVLRFLDIYQVIQALNTVLTNPKQLSEMRRSWAKVDFESVRNQSALVCNCRHEDLVQLLEVEFVALLETVSKSQEPVREVMSWADKCCERLMGNGRVSSEDRGMPSSRSILIRWGYVTSQVMRDLTIRSDPAFGAFQILKLFLDDWISVNVLRNVALSTHSVAASVEPVMQQNFFEMSPVAAQEGFKDGSQTTIMAHTPTTSSMLAALQNDSFPSGSDAFTPGSMEYGSMSSYMDTTASGPDSAISDVPHGLSFSDFAGTPGSFEVTAGTPGSFDVPAGATSAFDTAFGHDLALGASATGTPGSSGDTDSVHSIQRTGSVSSVPGSTVSSPGSSVDVQPKVEQASTPALSSEVTA